MPVIFTVAELVKFGEQPVSFILGHSSDIAALRREFESEGWSEFDDSADPWNVDAKNEYRRSEDEDPMIAPFPR